jgi:catechol 2,3-dioxygenase-like lactoylglutathione lyase family enzyme
MALGIARIAQVKLPVSDLARSVAWYRELLDLRLWTEFVEDGVLVGAGLMDPEQRFAVALRDRRFCASEPVLGGFDVVAFQPSDESVLHELVERCARLGIAHPPPVRTPDGSALDIPDPDGTVLRFYHYTGLLTGFQGLEFTSDGHVTTYDTPRLAP